MGFIAGILLSIIIVFVFMITMSYKAVEVFDEFNVIKPEDAVALKKSFKSFEGFVKSKTKK